MVRALRLKSVVVLAAFVLGSAAFGAERPAAARASAAGEIRAARAFDAARKSPLALHAFLAGMPKGADLHMHLSGAVYAETFLQEAAADKLCVNPAIYGLTPNIGTTQDAAAQAVCAYPNVPAAKAFTDQKLYDALVDSFSMRDFVPSAGASGHDQFFGTFARFSGLKSHNPEWLDEVATRAAAQNEQYLEIMLTPSADHAKKAAEEIGWPVEAAGVGGATPAQLADLRDKLLAAGLRDDVAIDQKEITDAFAARDAKERCGGINPAPACSVKIRIIYQVARANTPQQVFARTLLGFELSSVDPRVVGINYVQPEDAYLAMSQYHRQMLMLAYLHGEYPKVHISLHAGELAPGLVPPDGLRFHIREAVEIAHAERIGHGVDVMYEDRPKDLLKEMAARHVMVEINVTSNEVILGVARGDHPLPDYRAAGVPVALSTDDEGVSRIDLTHEYVKAALDFGLSYADLKKMARTGIEHSFLPGVSLWAQPEAYGTANKACGTGWVEKPAAACATFLKSSEKAGEEWELERRFAAFEAGLK